MISEENINVLLQQIGETVHSKTSLLGIRAILDLKKDADPIIISHEKIKQMTRSSAFPATDLSIERHHALLDEFVAQVEITNNLKEKKAYYRLIQAYINEHYHDEQQNLRGCYRLLSSIPARYLPVFIEGLDAHIRPSAKLFLRAYAIVEHYKRFYPKHEQTKVWLQQFENFEFTKILEAKPTMKADAQFSLPPLKEEPVLSELKELEALLKEVDAQYADEP